MMLLRTFAVLLIALATEPALIAQVDEPVKVSSHVCLRMAGDLAKAYARCTGLSIAEQAKGLQIDVIATIVGLQDGRVRIEHSSPIVRDGKTSLVTLSADVASTELLPQITPKGTTVHSSPAKNASTTVTEQEAKTYRVELDRLTGVKIRFWSLVQEVGD